MSAASRQRTCAACGGELREDDRTNVEPLVDDVIRYVAVHAGCSTFSPIRVMNVPKVDSLHKVP